MSNLHRVSPAIVLSAIIFPLLLVVTGCPSISEDTRREDTAAKNRETGKTGIWDSTLPEIKNFHKKTYSDSELVYSSDNVLVYDSSWLGTSEVSGEKIRITQLVCYFFSNEKLEMMEMINIYDQEADARAGFNNLAAEYAETHPEYERVDEEDGLIRYYWEEIPLWLIWNMRNIQQMMYNPDILNRENYVFSLMLLRDQTSPIIESYY